LPFNHPARLVSDIIENELDLSRFSKNPLTAVKHGRPAYDPVMLLRIVLYGYMEGIRSSRKLAEACLERIDFRFLSGGLTPSFSTITKFRADHSVALGELFSDSVLLAIEEDLVAMGDVAFDGTKVLANASKHKAMSYARMREKVEQYHQEIEGLKKERRTATVRRKQEIERELEFKRERFAKLQEQKFALEDEYLEQTGELPKEKDQRNFTDPESRIMRKGAGFEQCYNAQAAVDKNNQIIVAAYVTQAGNDKQQLEPLVERTLQQMGLLPDRGLADAGYFSEAVVISLQKKYADAEWLISPGRTDESRILSNRSKNSSTSASKARVNISRAPFRRTSMSGSSVTISGFFRLTTVSFFIRRISFFLSN
jgi:Transposase and inactivated derivatives